ncbi:MAG TPA: 4Fe-4S binding protein [Spirochaetota bacterium]|nr:4Fe-4S binding protein [Spirochaetota bacterium]HQP49320.1 4Fe-4S binding protein [Spirochaetota bacterium]
MWLLSKIKQVLMVIKPGVVTLQYPFVPRPAPANFRGIPYWDHQKCVGCGGCAGHCPARTIMIRDICQELRVMVYDASRCTYCGRCADVCPEHAITMTEHYELATNDKNDITETIELFMATCQRCGRCYDHENRNQIDRLSRIGFRYDNLEMRAVIPAGTQQIDTEMLKKTESYKRPERVGE